MIAALMIVKPFLNPKSVTSYSSHITITIRFTNYSTTECSTREQYPELKFEAIVYSKATSFEYWNIFFPMKPNKSQSPFLKSPYLLQNGRYQKLWPSLLMKLSQILDKNNHRRDSWLKFFKVDNLFTLPDSDSDNDEVQINKSEVPEPPE